MGAGRRGKGSLWSDCVICVAPTDMTELRVCEGKAPFFANLLTEQELGHCVWLSEPEQTIDEIRASHMEDFMQELFGLHDLDGNGLLEEHELIALNEQIALLHYGHKADIQQVRTKYQDLFRSQLDADGRPVRYSVFKKYAFEVLNALDADPFAQEMILEQFINEAQSARHAMDLPIVVKRGSGVVWHGRVGSKCRRVEGRTTCHRDEKCADVISC